MNVICMAHKARIFNTSLLHHALLLTQKRCYGRQVDCLVGMLACSPQSSLLHELLLSTVFPVFRACQYSAWDIHAMLGSLSCIPVVW